MSAAIEYDKMVDIEGGGEMNMRSNQRTLLLSIVIALFSQIYISFLVSDFKISIAIILIPLGLFLFSNLDTMKLAIYTAGFVLLFRILVDSIAGGFSSEILAAHIPELFFYTFYGIILYAFCRNELPTDFNRLFLILVVSDFSANLIELLIRIGYHFTTFELKGLLLLLLVAVLRSSLVWLILQGLKFYRLLVIKEKHEERYRKLLWLISLLKTEMYWMKGNMQDIEKVMANAYQLFEKITSDKDQDSWPDLSLGIAKDVHEIKKDYGLVFRGIEEILENRLQTQEMRFKEVIQILKESMYNEEKHRSSMITLSFKSGRDFYTLEHYALMSVFRNLVMNSMDAMEDGKEEGRIDFVHEETSDSHVFSVQDTGSGIKDEDIPFIFSPGYSSKINYETGNVNRGLGLSLVKEIVEDQLDGTIQVQSKEGVGTTFMVFIPKEKIEVKAS